MRHLLFSFYLLFFVYLNSFSQTNIIKNGSFEQMLNGCNNPYLATYWDHLQSPDLFASCVSSLTPYQVPKDSFNFYGMATFHPSPPLNPLNIFSREYIQQNLTNNLKQGFKYCCTFYINLNAGSGLTHSNYGAYFSSSPINPCTLPTWTNYTPQVANTPGVFPDTTNWLKVSGSFIANGTEQYITLGNFDTSNLVIYDTLNPDINYWFTYMFLDDVHLVEVVPIAINADSTLCIGDSVQLQSTVIDAAEYQWLPSTGLSCSFCPSPKASPPSTTQYTLVVKQCEVIDTLRTTITVIPNSSAPALCVNDTLVCLNDAINLGLNPQDSGSYQWSPPILVNPNNVSNPNIVAQQNQWYFLQKDYCGLTSFDSVYIQVKECEPEILIPNVFTPNSDGTNEVFQITTREINSLHIQIFNRWGNLVFESKDSQPRWDGFSTSGKKCSEGHYFYTLTAKTNRGEEIKKQGYLLLVK